MAVQAEQKGLSAVAFGAACLLGGTAVLAGCTLQQPLPASPQNPPKLETGGRGFFLNLDGANASLTYGRANSDDVDLMLQCDKGSREVQIIDAARVPAKAKGPMTLILILASGAAVSQLRAQTGADETGQTLANAHAPSDLAALMGFRRTGALSVKIGDGAYALSATPAELIAIAKFFAVCERK